MSNLKVIGSELENNGTGYIASLNTYQKRSPNTVKKTSLRDVQSENRGPMQNCIEKSAVLEERADVNSMKFAGSKRIGPECPPTLPSSQVLSSSSSIAMSHQQNLVRRHDLSFGPAPASSITFPCPSPSVPISLIKPVNPRTSIESNHREYIQRLLSMAPTELSKHAVELEKRSMQLTRAANREIHRKAAFNINLAQTPSGGEQGTSSANGNQNTCSF